jgi:hypothetical protein
VSLIECCRESEIASIEVTITIQIQDNSRDFSGGRDIDESWVNEQINRRRRDGQAICVRVLLHEDPINISLSSGCPASGGSSRRPNSDEQKIFDLWDKVGMNKADFRGGNLLAFLKQLHRVID